MQDEKYWSDRWNREKSERLAKGQGLPDGDNELLPDFIEEIVHYSRKIQFLIDTERTLRLIDRLMELWSITDEKEFRDNVEGQLRCAIIDLKAWGEDFGVNPMASRESEPFE